MLSSLSLLCALTVAAPPAAPPSVETRFTELSPLPAAGKFVRTADHTRAVILVHGFMLRLSARTVARAHFHSWQQPNTLIVKELGRVADVYAYAYGQDAPLETIAKAPGLGDAVARLRKLGYKEIILVGHSAGGLVARHFVEDNPTAGVTKVIQVCCPNGGCPSATSKVHKNQQVFLDCLSPKGRQKCLAGRKGLRIPDKVQFVCVVAHSKEKRDTDGLVPCVCQWPEDLRQQGIPAVRVTITHHMAVRNPRGTAAVVDLVKTEQPRWTADRVREKKKDILGP